MEQALSGDLGWHAAMLLDAVRVEWFAQAVAAAVHPGDIVLDLGSGTGLLAMLAARAGANHVYAFEQSAVAGIARDLLEHNHLHEQVTVMQGNSFDLRLRERVDVIISETLGAWGADEGIAAIMADAATRLARPQARMVPESITLWLAPVVAADSAVVAPHLQRLGLNFDPFFALLSRPAGLGAEGGQATLDPSRVYGPAQSVLTIALGHENPQHYSTVLDFVLPRHVTIGALAAWFTATAQGVEPLSTAPTAPPTMWAQVLVALRQPIQGPLRVQLDLQFERDGMVVEAEAQPL